MEHEPSEYPRPGDIGEILVSQDRIERRVADLGREITADLAGEVPLLVGILKGSALFTADLMRSIVGPVEIDFMAVSSYGDATKSSGVVRIVKDLDAPVAGRHVILVEDIVDSGLTLRYLLDHLASQGPASVRSCALLVRDHDEGPAVAVDYVGFTIPPAFVIGYGLDVAQRYRNLPYIATYTGPT